MTSGVTKPGDMQYGAKNPALTAERAPSPEALCSKCGLLKAEKKSDLCRGCQLGFRSSAERKADR